MQRPTFRRVTASALSMLSLAACAPRLAPIAGVPAPALAVRAELPPGHRRIVFDWTLEDGEQQLRGQGVARVAPPDSVRLDFFVGGFGSSGAVLVGDELRSPGPDALRRLVPPPPLLWAALGRLAVPALADTLVRVDASVTRADIGRPVQWRVALRGDTLVRLERVAGGRIVEWVERDGATVRYRNESTRRSLRLVTTRELPADAFDPAIWDLR